MTQDYILEFVEKNPWCTTADIVDSTGPDKWKRTAIVSNTRRKCQSLVKYGEMECEMVDGMYRYRVVK